MAKRGSVRTRKQVEDVSEDYVSASDEEDADSIHSDALDEVESDDAGKTKTRSKRRRVTSPSKRAQTSKNKPDSKPEKRTPSRKRRKVVEETAADEHESDVELKDGQEVVGKVVEAPTTGWGIYVAPSKTLCATHRPLDSSRRSDISAHAGFSGSLERPSMQRSRLVSIDPSFFVPLRTVLTRPTRFKLHGTAPAIMP